MVFDKQHLGLFVALAFLLAYSNAVPTTALSNENNVERLRGDLHQFIEMIIGCLANTKLSNHSKSESSQLNHFKQIANNLQEDVGLEYDQSRENADNIGKTRKFEEPPSETAESGEVELNSGSNEDSEIVSNETTESNSSKESTKKPESSEENEEIANRREFDVPEGDKHGYTPRPSNTEVTESTTNADMHTKQPLFDFDIGSLFAPKQNDHQHNTSPERKATSSEAEDDKSHPLNILDKFKVELIKLRQNLIKAGHIFKQRNEGRKSYGDESASSNSNESKDKSENNTEEIQVRNLIHDAPEYASDSSVHPYEALHIYGIRKNGPINKIVFEGGEHHPPRPLTIQESIHLKEFINMILENNHIQNTMATFPVEDEISSRSGFNDKYMKKSPWADKPVPVELV